MSKSNHAEAQMIGALRQMEAGRKADDVARAGHFSYEIPTNSASAFQCRGCGR